ncbi:Positive regulator of CheA protein activity (CheW) [hydrothermal vent metagenome]|uniref:Chemotaxis protein CheW n=1 Tax=hydrothermal vent metagenome TaxID=652676 RepID=A0A3B1BQU8_9ZZZZ
MAEAKLNNDTQLQGGGSLEEFGAQYLTFSLAEEEYGVDILRVQEIRGWDTVTRVPNAPAYVKGVLNLRGAIVPIFDLLERFNLSLQGYTKDTVVIVLRVMSANGMRSIGVVVDAVSDVLNSTEDSITNTPDFGGSVATEYISGLVSAGGKMIMLLDVDKLLCQDEGIGTENVKGS